MADSNTVHVATPMVGPPGYEARFVKVEGQVDDLRDDISDIKSTMSAGFKEIAGQVKEIGAAVAAKGSPNWVVIGVLSPILVAAVAAVWILFSTYSAHVESALGEQKVAAGSFMKREDIVALIAGTEKTSDISRNFEEKIADLKEQIAEGKVGRLAADVADLQAKQVPLSTHQEIWKAQADTNKALADQIADTRKALEAISAPRDTITRIYKRLDDIEGEARARGVVPAR